MGSGHIKRFDAASSTKQVASGAGMKLIFNQFIMPFQQFEVRLLNKDMNESRLAADRTIAAKGPNWVRQTGPVANASAVASALAGGLGLR